MAEEISVSHLGICVSDIDRSIRFYEHALGFEMVHRFESTTGGDFDKLIGFDDFAASYAFLRNGTTLLELVCYAEPAVEKVCKPIALNRSGLSYLCFRVENMDAVCDSIEAHGGRSLRETRVATPQGALMFCLDPDGTRIELLKR